MLKEGYKITIMGKKFEREVLFFEDKPNENELEELIKKHQGVRAFISRVELFIAN